MPVGRSNFSSSPYPQMANWFLDLLEQGRLDLDPPYQRRSVWNVPFKRYFVDTMIRHYPSPPIFLEVEVDPSIGVTTYRVIDGKQRLTALREFVGDEFTTPDTLDELSLGGKYFSELPDEARKAIYSYPFRVEMIETNSASELSNVFDRLNRNVARLNKQELRHAQFGGAFITKAEDLAESEFWTQVGVAPRARIARMLDVELVSELYVVVMDGVQDGKDYLDDYCAKYDEEIPNAPEVDLVFDQTVSYLQALDQELGLKRTRYSNAADFYSLWAAIVAGMKTGRPLPDPAKAAAALAEFAAEVEKASHADEVAQDSAASGYLLAARQGSNKGSNRQLRADILARILGLDIPQ